MKAKSLLHNARIHTQAGGLIADSMAICRNRSVAVGNDLKYDPDFSSYQRVDLKGRTVTPGFVDAHTHFFFFALSLGHVSLQGLTSIEACRKKIKKHTATLKRTDWVVGEGYAPDLFAGRREPDRQALDTVTGGRPAIILSKDQHSAWVNSRALELAGITANTPQPAGGEIVRSADGAPSGILRETAYQRVFELVPLPSRSIIDKHYRQAVDHAHRMGVTGVHSFDGTEAFAYFSELAAANKLGLRINYYPPAIELPRLHKTGTRYATGDEFLRIAGVKIFADGSLGSQTALCFNKYLGSKDNSGIEVTPVPELKRLIKSASRLGLPSAIHAIGDRAVANVLDALETAPRLRLPARHRIEHLQLMRRKDIPRLKKLGVVPSMQPSHCPADIKMTRKYWGARARNAYIFRTLTERGIPLAFGSDVPIEPLDPLAGIAAAVRRARPGSRDTFYPEERLSADEALHAFTAGSAIAAGQEHCRGYLLPGYVADFEVLSGDITRVSASRLYDVRVLATVLDGKVKYCDGRLSL